MIGTCGDSSDSFARHRSTGSSDGDWDCRCGGRVVTELTAAVISPRVDSAITGES